MLILLAAYTLSTLRLTRMLCSLAECDWISLNIVTIIIIITMQKTILFLSFYTKKQKVINLDHLKTLRNITVEVTKFIVS